MQRSILSTVLLFCAVIANAQFGIGSKHIQGQVRIDGKAAPQGVLVYLDHSRGKLMKERCMWSPSVTPDIVLRRKLSI
jgi:hypothetical protein